MHAAVLAHLPQATIVIKAAAVSDFRPATVAPQKLKRTGPLTLSLEPTEDIAQSVAAHRNPGTLLIAFAAETPIDAQDLVRNAREKLGRKGADAIVANDVSQPDLGFDSERNAAIFITTTREIVFPAQSKSSLAHRILDEAAHLRTGAVLRRL
jgi:phosphopantothenoylcysteine decarboxylase/phosphopantothenate--cysteine ligase